MRDHLKTNIFSIIISILVIIPQIGLSQDCFDSWGGYPSEGKCNYRLEEWKNYESKVINNPYFKSSVLVKSSKGNDVIIARAGKIDGNARYKIYLQARQHPKEWKNSYVLEGVLNSVLHSENKLINWLRENVEVIVVPIVNIDNVQINSSKRGSDGHKDLNRIWGLDTTDIHCPAIMEIKKLITTDKRIKIAFDFHSPNLDGGGGRGYDHSWSSVNTNEQNAKKLRSMIDEFNRNSVSKHLIHISEGVSDRKVFFTEWASGLEHIQAAATLETRQNDLTVNDCYEYGNDIILGLASWLQTYAK